MQNTKRVLSIVLALLVAVSMVSCFTVVGSAAESIDKFIYNPFDPISNPGYGTTVPSGVVFVDDNWAGASAGSYVYMDYGFGIYKALVGVNAFGSLADALDACRKPNAMFKLGAGNYNDDLSINQDGLQFYGNYAGINPNVATDKFYKMDLNPKRDPSKESIISAKWTWTINGNNITIDGTKVTGMTGSAKFFDIAVSGATAQYFNFLNNIVEANTGDVFNANKGRSNGTYWKYNRFVNNTGRIAMCGGQMNDTVMDNNYFEGNGGAFIQFTSCGSAGSPTLISFSNNIAYNCTQGVNFGYDNNNFGVNLDYKRVENNVFCNVGSSSKYIIRCNLPLQYIKNDAVAGCNDTASKNVIKGNIFYSVPSGVTCLRLDGPGMLTAVDGNFIVNFNENKVLYAKGASAGTAVNSSIIGIVDASRNLYGNVDLATDAITVNKTVDSYFSITSDTRLVTAPFYLDAEMTQLSGGITLSPANARILRAQGFDTTGGKKGIEINNEQTSITATPVAGSETVDFTNTISPLNWELYEDFMLSKKIDDNKVDITGDLTRAFLLATDPLTGLQVKYEVLIKSDTDKTKNELRSIFDETTGEDCAFVTPNGSDYDINLPSRYLNFPFSLKVSPSATYKIYTNPARTTEYSDDTYYVEPDKTMTLYVRITSGNGLKKNDFKLNIKRPGSADHDAKIIRVVEPVDNILFFNNSRKSIAYRPFAMIDKASFDFEVSKNATYAIYSDKACTRKVSDPGDIKELPVGDGINYYYVKITSSYNFTSVYTLTIYNDVKSDVCEIFGITGIEDVPIDENNNIRLDVSSTLSNVNAHFETDAFANVVVYADKDKTYQLKPSITMDTIHNREVEVKTFKLGLTACLSYFWVEITSETGKKAEYSITVSKGNADIKFVDIDNSWAKSYIEKAASMGIVNGTTYEDGSIHFLPNGNATRQEMAVMLCRMFGIDEVSFKDESLSGIFTDSESIADWSYNYVKACYKLGIMTGSKEGDAVKFNPKSKITRQEFFVAVCNVLKLDKNAAKTFNLSNYKDYKQISAWAYNATQAVVKAGIISGDDNGKLNPKANITRAEVCVIATKINTIEKDI